MLICSTCQDVYMQQCEVNTKWGAAEDQPNWQRSKTNMRKDVVGLLLNPQGFTSLTVSPPFIHEW